MPFERAVQTCRGPFQMSEILLMYALTVRQGSTILNASLLAVEYGSGIIRTDPLHLKKQRNLSHVINRSGDRPQSDTPALS